ncbi:pyridoxine biosynthesis protein [Marasmius tenuissimus]|uniref:Pyridoxine biosynthesis protein n=1 Tax=Marasmius tenuissimus TaxID=585030 RepID=A0ABR3AA27_9AGAR
MSSIRKISQTALKASKLSSKHTASRCLHQSSRRSAITKFQMPAMSPTMSEGGIASWKKKEGEAFSAGDVLLEIETDKATIDVEAQEDGVVGKIILPDGTKNVQVGKVIALLAEEGDDISNLEVPKEEDSAPALEARLLTENGIADGSKITGTGIRGMLTKGDVLAFLGKASGPLGTFKPPPSPIEQAAQSAGAAPKKEEKPLDGPAIRQLIVSTMLSNSLKARSLPTSSEPADFDSIIADYLPKSTPVPKATVPTPEQTTSKPSSGFLDGLI